MCGLVTHAMIPIELAHEIGGSAAAGDQDGVAARELGSPFFQETREARGQLNPVEQAATDLDDCHRELSHDNLDSTRESLAGGT